MNRPIKFRAWDIKQQKMSKMNGNYYSYDPYNNENKYIWMQYTGLKDKNGKKLYEGDIIDEGLYIGWCDKCKQYQVFNCLNDCMSCGGDIPWCEFLSDISNTEILGNIYENKDLINK